MPPGWAAADEPVDDVKILIDEYPPHKPGGPGRWPLSVRAKD
jgi:hypothetical protein